VPAHAFVDESIRNGYLLSAAVVPTGDLSVAGGKLRELCKPGQRRLHMKDENDSRRREILSTLIGLGIEVYLYRARSPAERFGTAATSACVLSSRHYSIWT
jgi:hypothetical protein